MKRWKLPKDDADLYELWLENGQSNTKVAELFGTHESAVRRRVYRYAGIEPRPYKKMPMAGRELYEAWLKAGGDSHAAGILAARWGVKSQSLRAAMRRYLNTLDSN
jgi:transposase